MDLSLVPITDLLEEIDKRTDCFIGAYFLPDEIDDLKFWYGKKLWSDSVMLASMLNNMVLNNYRGELKTLQDLNDEEEDEEED